MKFLLASYPQHLRVRLYLEAVEFSQVLRVGGPPNPNDRVLPRREDTDMNRRKMA